MATDGIKVNMTPSHPGDFIRTEVIGELGLSVTKAAQVLGVRRATLSDLLNGKAALSPEMALRIEKAFDMNMDYVAADAGLVRCLANACPCKRDHSRALRARLNDNRIPPCIGSARAHRAGRQGQLHFRRHVRQRLARPWDCASCPPHRRPATAHPAAILFAAKPPFPTSTCGGQLTLRSSYTVCPLSFKCFPGPASG